MDTKNTLNSIPIDLFNEIFSRLPIKAVGRCRCVSKILASRLGSEDFKQLFLTRSLTRPRLLFAVNRNNNEWAFYSSPQPQNPYEKSLVVTAEFPRSRVHTYIYAFGLFYFPNMCISTTKGEEDTSHVICNPSTGQYMILPELITDIWSRNFLGFDPIDKQFKLLVMNARVDQVNNDWVGCILTIGTGKMRWRTINCPFLRDYPCICGNGICINGVLYYLAQDHGGMSRIICFDVRTETFEFIVIDVQESCCKLINYKGKLGVTILRSRFHDDRVDYYVELYMLVLEDEQWSKYCYSLPTINFKHGLCVVGMTSTDEIVLSTVLKQFNLYYFNMEKNSVQSVEVQGLENHDFVLVIMDHVEDLNVNDAKYFKSNIHAKPRETPGTSKRQSRRIKFESINTFEALCLLDEEDDDA